MDKATMGRAALPCFGFRRRVRAAFRFVLGGAAAVAVAGLAAAPLAATPKPGEGERILLKPKFGRDDPTAATKHLYGAKLKRVFRHVGNLQVVELPAGLPAATAVNLLRQTGEFAYVEEDRALKLHGVQPNDVRYLSGELWGLNNTGYLDGTPGADIDAAEAWAIRREAPNLIVALVDSGIRLTHEDLAPNLWRNPGEIPGNGIDDDGNGVIDDVHGYNAWLDNGNPNDGLGHGTHVAGTIGAVGNNTLGVTGVCWKVQLMAAKFTDDQGNGLISDAVACIDYARRMGAHVVNASWGTTWFHSEALYDAIKTLRDAGIIFVTVAANGMQSDNDVNPVYPAGYDLDNIVVVTATDRNDQLPFFANYGAKSVDLGAPGHNIFSCWVGSDSDYQYYNGGSMAVAHVSGAVALLKAQFPGDDYRKTIERILTTVDPLPALAGRTVTGGRLNLFKALGGSYAPPSVTIAATDASASENAGDAAVFTFTRSGATTTALTVGFAVDGTATNGGDYASLLGSVTIPAGAASASVTVQPIDDTLYEGSETITLTLVPGAGYTVGAAASASATIADNDPEPDTTAPVFASLSATPMVLSPANKKMVDVTLAASVTDNRDRAPRVRLVSVWSNQPPEDGRTPDWEITGDMTLRLRAEKARHSDFRVYVLTVEARDAAGNTARRAAYVFVP